MRSVPHFPLKSRGSRGSFFLRLHCVLNLQKSPAAPRLHPSSAAFRIRGAVELLASPLATSAMAPKSEKAKADKAKKEKSEQAAKLAALRKRSVVFAPRLGAKELRNKYYLFWSGETKLIPAP